MAGLLVAMGVAGFGLGLAARTAGAAQGGGDAGTPPSAKPAVARAWHGKTPRARADEYEKYLSAAIAKFPTIRGNLGYQLMRLDGGPDGEAYTEFQVISYWESREAIRAYAGDDIRRTRSLPRDPEFLVDLEPQVRNYDLRVDQRGGEACSCRP